MFRKGLQPYADPKFKCYKGCVHLIHYIYMLL